MPTTRPRPLRRWALAFGAIAFVLATARFAADAPDASANSGASDDAHPAVDIAGLDMIPLEVWGVSGQTPSETQTQSIDNLVWDIQQVGDRIFVGGAFLNVQETENSTPIPQPYLAAFDLDTGDWISSCTPSFDRAIYALTVNSRGSLLVGGEFTTVNGVPREGLVAIDPTTCDTDPLFVGSVERPWSSLRAMVRELEVVDGDLYLAGNFSHVDGHGGRQRAYKAARMDARWGTIDGTWKPEVSGSGVWGLAVDPDRGHVHLSGFFSSVNGLADSGYFHTVDDASGASVAGLTPLPRNYPASQFEMFDVAMGDGLVVISGEQHIVQMLDADTHDMVAFAHTGNEGCPGSGFDHFAYGSGFAGGAYQVAERVGDVVFAGCHCTYAERYGRFSHYSSVTDSRQALKLLMAYDAATGEIIEEFDPDFTSPRDGTWAVASDTNGCLYVGGDLNRRGVDAGIGGWLGGFAKLCPHGWAPPGDDTTPPLVPQSPAATETPDGVLLTWDPSEDPTVPGQDVSGLQSYLVFRDGAYLAWTDAATTSYEDLAAPHGVEVTYTVRAVDNVDNQSADSAFVTLTPGGTDLDPPTVPIGVAVSSNAPGEATITWDPSTDPGSGVKSYLIFRDGAYLSWTDAATIQFSETGLTDGVTYGYTVKAVDNADNESAASDPVTITPGGPDLDAPTTPDGVTADGDVASVTVAWAASTDVASGVQSYLVYRDGAYIGWTDAATLTFTDASPIVGLEVGYSVRAVDNADNRSETSDPALFTAGGTDATAPSVPGAPVVVANDAGDVEIGWTASTDDLSGVISYQVYRDGAYIGWTDAATLAFTDTGRTPGDTHLYQLRATDAAGNRSEKSDPAIVTVQ